MQGISVTDNSTWLESGAETSHVVSCFPDFVHTALPRESCVHLPPPAFSCTTVSESTLCSEKNTHSRFRLYLRGKCLDLHKIFTVHL